ncbi:MAG: hypothetical protein HRU38_12805 [Saccharospirillaceae bacterium]|nr:hypothetical protein [Pseudomonadales bacterium]NRB79523.1 hypothetical protein [Saccharospirillaceae bacterium]
MTQISGYQPPEFKERERFFSKRTLWIMNLILIPLIFVLATLGQNDSDDVAIDYVAPNTEYLLADLTFNKTQYAGLDLHWVNLDNSQKLYFGFVFDRQPVASIQIPPFVNVKTQAQGGQLWIQIDMPNNREVIYDALVFMKSWLPLLTSNNKVVIAGELDQKIVASLVENLMFNDGESTEFFTSATKFVQTIESPQIGSEEFEVFYVVHLILKSRILSNRINVIWDTKTQKRLLGFNSVIEPSWLLPIKNEEFDRIMSDLSESLKPAQINVDGLMRYLMHQAGYNLPPNYFHTRALRYRQVSLLQINAQLIKLQELLIKK